MASNIREVVSEIGGQELIITVEKVGTTFRIASATLDGLDVIRVAGVYASEEEAIANVEASARESL